MKPILIYGAYGYSGRLALLHARTLGLSVIAAGRDGAKTERVAREAGCEYRVFSLDNAADTRAALSEASVVLNCAGPFRYTSDAMIRLCLETNTHYLDITGEYHVIENAARYDQRAKNAALTIMPAVGFDVVPTDCMAAYLKEKLPAATTLDLAFFAAGGMSHGTAQTMVDSLGSPSACRRDGRLVEEPLASEVMEVPFGPKRRTVISIPWGDVASAYYTTGIPNIRTFTTASPRAAKFLSRTTPLHGMMGIGPIRWAAKKLVSATLDGPDEETRAQGGAIIWGRASNDKGETVEANLHTLETYTLTYLTSVDLAKRAQEGTLPSGYQTPAGALGAEYVLWLDETEFRDL